MTNSSTTVGGRVIDVAAHTRFESLEASAKLLNSILGIRCLVVGPDSKIAMQLPENHVGTCFCKELGKVTETDYSLDHFFNRFEKLAEESSYSIYNCPMGLANIIIPTYEGGAFAGALQVGPVLTVGSDELLRKQGLPNMNVDVTALARLLEFLKDLPHGDINYLIVLAKTLNALINDDRFEFGLEMDNQRELESQQLAAAEADTDPDIICAVQEFVSTHFTDNDISLDTVAKGVYVHPSYVSHIFSNQFNCHFRGYINSMRIRLAAELLETTDKTVGEICFEVGFSDHSYFNKVFRQLKGMTPSAYRSAKRHDDVFFQGGKTTHYEGDGQDD